MNTLTLNSTIVIIFLQNDLKYDETDLAFTTSTDGSLVWKSNKYFENKLKIKKNISDIFLYLLDCNIQNKILP